jgi:hypothetical protein
MQGFADARYTHSHRHNRYEMLGSPVYLWDQHDGLSELLG